jgi:hypothetical protein
MSKGNYSNGFSINDYNKDRKRKENFARRQNDTRERVAGKAAIHLKTLESGKMVSLSCSSDDAVIQALKGMVRGDSRFFWNYDNNDRVHFSRRKLSNPTGLKKEDRGEERKG